MKFDQPISLLIDSGSGWFDATSSPIAGIFGVPAFTLSFSGDEVRLWSGSEEMTSGENPLLHVELFTSQGYTAIGYISYDYLAYTTPGITTSGVEKEDELPLLFFNFYKNDGFCTIPYEDEHALTSIEDYLSESPAHFNHQMQEYTQKIAEIKKHIAAGEVYQVNLSRKFQFDSPGNPLTWFTNFYRVQPVPFAAFIGFPNFEIISGSMELFLKKRGNRITTKPIKGTIRRDLDPNRDRELAAALKESPKERAENLMIVDLMRNDLGRICEYGSVDVKELFTVKPYNTLFQMESEIEGNLRPGIRLSEILTNTFPPGSVTGAPKREALRLIDRLEPHLRGPYCGALCLFEPSGDFTLSVAIRTGVNRADGMNFCFGSGIVWDSKADEEYREIELKAKALKSVLR